MADLTTMTLEDMATATKSQIVSDLTATATKRDLIVLLTGTDRIVKPTQVYRKDGQIESETTVETDVETGEVLGSRLVTWTYYDTGEVDEITTSIMDAKGNETERRVIKHYLDGSDPTVETSKTEIIDMQPVEIIK